MRHGVLALNYAELSALLSSCGRCQRLRFGSSIHAFVVKNASVFKFRNHNSNLRDLLVVWNSLISMYSKCSRLSDAVKVFDEMPLRDTVSWNSLISGFLARNEIDTGFWYFRTMLGSKVCRMDQATMTTVLSVCARLEFFRECAVMHAVVVTHGFEHIVPVGNALVTAYFKCKSPGSAKNVFGEMLDRNVITWTAMVAGLAQSQLCEESMDYFQEMRRLLEANLLTYSSSLLACSGLRDIGAGRQVHGLVLKSGFELDLCVQSALMDVYSKCGSMQDAYQIFQSCEDPDEVFLTVILVGFAQNGLEEQAFDLFAKMVSDGIGIDADMLSAVLGAFVASAPFAFGKQIHALAIKRCFQSNTFVSNGLINMYSKCGELSESLKVFNQIIHKNSVSWNSAIAAFARHGQGNEALHLYEAMQLEGVEPTDVTFLSLLHACSHIGAFEKGMEFIRSMASVHKIEPRTEHYACIVDMLGRAGLVDEARRFIDGLPNGANAILWQALLGACSIHGNSDVGEYAANQLLLLEPDSAAGFVLLANIYSARGRWVARAEVIRRMKEMKVKKDVGVSWIEVERGVHSFVVEDKLHAQAESVYKVLSSLAAVIGDQENVFDNLIPSSTQLKL